MENLDIIYATLSKKEAFINELKGSLFEYLVALEISQKLGIESKFLVKFEGEEKERLLYYQKKLSDEDIDLVRKLPSLAIKTVEGLFSSFKWEEKALKLELVGRASKDDKSEFPEADILCHTEKGYLPLSLKLSKDMSFVNTKSGGIKSFLTRYFSEFEDHLFFQKQLTLELEDSFKNMMEELFDLAELSYSQSFKKTWVEAGYSELPGELNLPMNAIVVNFYKLVNQKFYQFIKTFYEKDLQLFKKSLLPLVGIGNSRIVQATCFYKNITGKNEDKYHFSRVRILTSKLFEKELDNIKMGDLDLEKGFFYLSFKNYRLQIRLKPMNKFTVPGLKVNCSLGEFREDCKEL